MKRILCLMVFILIAVSLPAVTYLYDNASLLTQNERDNLSSLLEKVSAKTGISTVIVTSEENISYSAQDSADLVIEEEEFGEDGVCLFLSMDTREYAISTQGYAMYALDDYALSKKNLEGVLFPYLYSGDYYKAFSNFASYVSVCSEYSPRSDYDNSTLSSNGTYYIENTGVKRPFNWLASAFFSFAIAGFISYMIIAHEKRKLRNTGYVNNADDYVVPSSFAVNVHKDIFLYSNVRRVRRNTEPPRGGHGGAHHTTVHTSSSGRSHGGSSGRF